MAEQEENKNTELTDEQPQNKFDNVYNELLEVKNQISVLQKKEKELLKKMHNIHNKYIKKTETKKRKANHSPTGFNTGRTINGQLADWFGIENGTVLRGPEISKLFWQKIKVLGLQSKEDGRVFRTNSEVSKIFGVPKSVNKINKANDENGFNMRTYQKYIKYALDNQGN